MVMFGDLNRPTGGDLVLSIQEAKSFSETKMQKMRKAVSDHVGGPELLEVEIGWNYRVVVFPDRDICNQIGIPYDRPEGHKELVAGGVIHFYYEQLEERGVA